MASNVYTVSHAFFHLINLISNVEELRINITEDEEV